MLEYVRWVMVRQARRGGAGARRSRAARCRRRCCRACSAMPARRSTSRPMTSTLAGSPHRFGDYAVGEQHRPCRRHHGRGGRAPDRDPALPEHRAHPLQPVRAGAGPLRPAADLWRARDLARPRAHLQRPRQCVPRRGDQRRPARGAACSPARPCSPGREVLARAELPGRDDVGALRLRTVADRRTSPATTFR